MSKPSYESARLELARLRIDSRAAYDGAIVRAAELSARTLGVERVGVWLFDAGEPSVLHLEHLFVASTGEHTDGELLAVSLPTRYRDALLTHKALAIDDARSDLVTSELTQGYLAPLGITSLLDAPLFLRGEVAGVICHEHVGAPRRWTTQEIDFACTLADTASLVCEQARRLSLERELREQVASVAASENMETVTLLVRSLAHELGNVFTATRLGTDQLARTGDEATRALTTAMGDALSVGERLARDLRQFADRSSSQPPAAHTPIDLLLARFGPILELLTRGVATLEVRAEPGLVLGLDDTAVEQIVLNLVLNARDALAGAGRTGQVHVEVERAERGALLRVRDDGPGIGPTVRAQLEREYFTTKPHGTGLGLSVARRLAQAANGELRIVDVPVGACIELCLPRVA